MEPSVDDFRTLCVELRSAYDVIIADSGPFLGSVELLPVAAGGIAVESTAVGIPVEFHQTVAFAAEPERPVGNRPKFAPEPVAHRHLIRRDP